MIENVFRRITRLARSRGAARPQAQRDCVLAERIRDAFERDLEMTGVRGLHFYVQDGCATIYGTVQNELDRELLVAFVRQIDGVRDATPHLQLTGQSASGAARSS